MEVAEQFPPELHEAAKFGHPLEPTDESGHMLTLKEFVKVTRHICLFLLLLFHVVETIQSSWILYFFNVLSFF